MKNIIDVALINTIIFAVSGLLMFLFSSDGIGIAKTVLVASAVSAVLLLIPGIKNDHIGICVSNALDAAEQKPYLFTAVTIAYAASALGFYWLVIYASALVVGLSESATMAHITFAVTAVNVIASSFSMQYKMKKFIHDLQKVMDA